MKVRYLAPERKKTSLAPKRRHCPIGSDFVLRRHAMTCRERASPQPPHLTPGHEGAAPGQTQKRVVRPMSKPLPEPAAALRPELLPLPPPKVARVPVLLFRCEKVP